MKLRIAAPHSSFLYCVPEGSRTNLVFINFPKGQEGEDEWVQYPVSNEEFFSESIESENNNKIHLVDADANLNDKATKMFSTKRESPIPASAHVKMIEKHQKLILVEADESEYTLRQTYFEIDKQ